MVTGRVSVLFFVFTVMACKHGTSKSDVTEAPDARNQPANLGIAPPYRWADVKDLTQAALPPAWSDTYWPLQFKGLAERWAKGAEGFDDNLTLDSAVGSALAAIKSKNISQIAQLSPAEKYDLLVGQLDQLPSHVTAQIAALKQVEDQKLGPKLKAWNQTKKDLLSKILQGKSKADALQRQFAQVAAKLNQALAKNSQDEVARLNAQLNAIKDQVNGIYAELQKYSLTLGNVAQEEREARRPYLSQSMPLLEAMKRFSPMTSESWRTWTQWETSGTEDYGWMGHCHGWAVAAIQEKRPRHAVLVKKKDIPILFTEGDIRGLLTKVWSDHKTPSKLAARRCESNDVGRDAQGRIEDGRICYNSTQCGPDEGSAIFVDNNNLDRGLIQFRDQQVIGVTRFAVVTDSLGGDLYQVRVFSHPKQLNQWSQAGRPAESTLGRPAALHLTVGCRDVNPMTLHLALTKLIGGKKQAFVMDRDQGSEVWNQPVFAYKLNYFGLPLKGKTGASKQSGSMGLSRPGEPVAVDAVADDLAPFRAPGTAYLVGVEAELTYGEENGPLVTYQPDGSDEHRSNIQTAYTLELDKDLNIIGGEWGHLAQAGSEAQELSGHMIPDFLWYIPSAKPSAGGPWNVQLIGKIHQCSLAQDGLKTVTVNLADDENVGVSKPQKITYSECTI